MIQMRESFFGGTILMVGYAVAIGMITTALPEKVTDPKLPML